MRVLGFMHRVASINTCPCKIEDFSVVLLIVGSDLAKKVSSRGDACWQTKVYDVILPEDWSMALYFWCHLLYHARAW